MSKDTSSSFGNFAKEDESFSSFDAFSSSSASSDPFSAFSSKTTPTVASDDNPFSAFSTPPASDATVVDEKTTGNPFSEFDAAGSAAPAESNLSTDNNFTGFPSTTQAVPAPVFGDTPAVQSSAFDSFDAFSSTDNAKVSDPFSSFPGNTDSPNAFESKGAETVSNPFDAFPSASAESANPFSAFPDAAPAAAAQVPPPLPPKPQLAPKPEAKVSPPPVTIPSLWASSKLDGKSLAVSLSKGEESVPIWKQPMFVDMFADVSHDKIMDLDRKQMLPSLHRMKNSFHVLKSCLDYYITFLGGDAANESMHGAMSHMSAMFGDSCAMIDRFPFRTKDNSKILDFLGYFMTRIYRMTVGSSIIAPASWMSSSRQDVSCIAVITRVRCRSNADYSICIINTNGGDSGLQYHPKSIDPEDGSVLTNLCFELNDVPTERMTNTAFW